MFRFMLLLPLVVNNDIKNKEYTRTRIRINITGHNHIVIINTRAAFTGDHGVKFRWQLVWGVGIPHWHE